MSNRKTYIGKSKYYYFFYILLFCFIFYFFAKVHPLFVFDTDDWLYVQDSRGGQAWPVWKLWNPTKIFPEFLMPTVSWLSVIFVYPFSNDYIDALAIGYAFILAVFVLISAFLLERLLKETYRSTFFLSSFVIIFYITFLFFPIFKNDNVYLLSAADVTCVFNYTIPALLNISVCFYLLCFNCNSMFDKEYKNLAILIVVLYFCLNSNLFQSVILVSFAVASIILSMGAISLNIKTFSLLKYIKENSLFIGIVLYWFVVLFFEANGERASLSQSSLLSLDLSDTFESFWLRLRKLHRFFLYLLSANAIGLMIYLLKSRKNNLQQEDVNYILVEKKLFISFVVTLIFVLLLCSKIGCSYITRPDVVISFIIIILAMSLLSVTYLLVKLKKMVTVFPILVLVVTLYAIYYPIKYKETSYISGSVFTAKSISSDIVSQIINAEINGIDHIDIHIPKFNDGDNFPFANYGLDRIPKALYYHSITRKLIDVNFIQDLGVNQKYNLK